MKKVVLILLAILMVTTLALGFTACKSECDKGNHVWDQGTVDKEATCAAVGKIVYRCTECDYGQKVVDAPITNTHTPIDASIVPTCTATGTTGQTKCAVCGIDIDAGTVIPALGHSWAYSESDTDATLHNKYCTRTDCKYIETEPHNPNTLGNKCVDCGKVLVVDAPKHEHDDIFIKSKSAATCTTAAVEHWACLYCTWTLDRSTGEALGHDYTDAAWAPSTTAGKHVRTCTREGCGYRDIADHTPEVLKGTPATCTTAGTADGSKCSACGVVITECAPVNALGHNWEKAWNGDDTQHWHDCTRCDAKNGAANHDFGEDDHDLTCKICDMPRPGENYVLTYTVDGKEVQQSYKRLADAVAFIAENQAVNNVVINVNDTDKTLEGLGVVIPGGLTITINLHGSTYIVASDPVGSTGTATCGFQILAGSNITIKNGTITSEKGSGVKMLIQNYANLTLDEVTLDGRNLDAVSNAPNYTLSNNCGTVTIQNKSVIIARAENGVALDVWYNMGGNYPDGVFVTVGKTCTITGVIEYGSAQKGADLKNKAVLSLPAGTYNQLRYTSNVTACVNTGITIDGKALTANWGEWTTVDEPTCEQEGLAERFCKLCGLRDTKDLPKTSHTIAEATYVGGHQHQGVCTVCGQTETVDCTEVNNACTVCKRVLRTTEVADASIDTRQQGYENADDVTSIKSGKVTVTLGSGTNDKNSPKYYTTGSAIRLYGGNTMTIAVPEGTYIIKITITFGSGDGNNDITVDGGSFNDALWTGNANSVVFTIDGTSGHRRIRTITVQYTYNECNHFFDNNKGVVTTPATCTEDGEITYTCLDCENATETETIPAGHKLTYIPAEDSDCGDEYDGNVAYYECGGECGKYFEDEDATKEIAEEDIVIAWKHDCAFHERIPATKDENGTHNGTKAYYECKYCGKIFLDKSCETKIADSKESEAFKSWVVIEYECVHATLVWRPVDGEHIYICTECEEYIADRHNPEPGNWEGTDEHVKKCTVEGCGITCSSHSAQYATAYTVVDETYHAQMCADCNLVQNKHEADLGELVPVEGDDDHHHKVCGYQGCNYATAAEEHAIDIKYISGGKHGGTCDCGKTVESPCTPEGDYDACKDCGRIVVVGKNEESSLAVAATVTTEDSEAKTLTYVLGKVTYVLTEINANKGGFKDYSDLRLYANNTLTITVDGGLITKVEIYSVTSGNNKVTQSDPKASVGTQTFASNIQTTTLSGKGVESVTFTASVQSRFTKVVVYYTTADCYHEGEGVLQHKTPTAATCEGTGIKTDCYYCTACDTYFTTQDCTAIVTKANAVEPAKGHTYGDLIEARSATCELEEYKINHYHCEVCGTYFNAAKKAVEQADVIGTTVDHNWGAWKDNNNGTHTRTCSFDVHTETDACTLNLNVWEHDNDMHWHECPTCGHMYGEDEGWAEHKLNGDGVCDICEYDSKAVNISVSVTGGAASLVDTTLPKQARVDNAITFTVSVEEGYRIVSVTDYMADEKTIDGNNGTYTYTFTEGSVVDGAVLVNITIIRQVTVNLSAVENGTLEVTYGSGDNATTVTNGSKVDIGTTLTITVTPNTGYDVTSIEVDGATKIDNTNTYTVTDHVTITVSTIKLVIVKYTNPSNGSISITRKDGEDIQWTHGDNNPSEATLRVGTEIVITVEGNGSVTITYKFEDSEATTVSGKTANVTLTANVTISAEIVKVDPVTIVLSEKGYSNAEDVTKVEQDNVTINFAAGTNTQNTPKYYTTGSGVRTYSGNTITISVPTGKNITKIIFTCSGTSYVVKASVNSGTYSTNGVVGTWTGSANSVTFTGSSTTRIQKIEVEFA